jgi:hypothetical protein
VNVGRFWVEVILLLSGLVAVSVSLVYVGDVIEVSVVKKVDGVDGVVVSVTDGVVADVVDLTSVVELPENVVKVPVSLVDRDVLELTKPLEFSVWGTLVAVGEVFKVSVVSDVNVETCSVEAVLLLIAVVAVFLWLVYVGDVIEVSVEKNVVGAAVSVALWEVPEVEATISVDVLLEKNVGLPISLVGDEVVLELVTELLGNAETSNN